MRVPMVVLMLVPMRVFVFLRMSMLVPVLGLMAVLMIVLIVMVFVLLQKLFPRQILLAIDNHVDLGRGDSIAIHAADLQRGSNVQAANRFQQQLRRNPGRDKRAQKHVAADSRKAVQISNSHEFLTSPSLRARAQFA
jgi:hypothetical protein